MLNNTDNKIIEVLSDNSRLSYAEIGRKIRLSPSAVRERVQRMEEVGIIKKYSIKLDNKKRCNSLEAFMLLKVFPGQLKNVIKIIPNFKEIKEAHRITGSQNLHLKIEIKDQIELQKLLDKLMLYGDTTTFLILSEIIE